MLITNILQEGSRANDLDNANNWLLTKRFFLFDTLSGIPEGQYPNGKPTTVQYAKTMELIIKLDETNNEKISLPVLKINYRARSTSTIEQGGDLARSQVSFSTSYDQNTIKFNKNLHIVFYVWLVIMVLTVFIITYFEFHRPNILSQNDMFCQAALIKVLINTFDLFAKFFFWFIFGATGWIFVFFKLQDRVYTFMPPLEDYVQNYKQYDVIFGIVCATKVISMVFNIYFGQCQLELFMIDWERPKLHIHNFISTGKDNNDDGARSKFDVNAWRHLFLINEFHELQTHRIISSEVLLIAYALIMEGIGVINWTNHDPNLVIHDEPSPRNFTLFFFITACVIYGLGILYLIFRALLSLCGVTYKKTEFVDLCSVCNISFLMFDENLHGYYIHGRSPYGQAEISVEELRKALLYESQGRAQIRGIEEGDENNEDLQTYEIYLPAPIMKTFKTDYLKEVNSAISQAQLSNNQLGQNVALAIKVEDAIPKNIELEKLDIIRKVMNKIMINYVEQVKSEPNKFVQDRPAIERLLNKSPFLPTDDKNYPIMFRDRDASFTNFFL